MAVLSHAMLFIASFFATPIGMGHAQVDTCRETTFAATSANENAWLPAVSEVSVRVYGLLRTREVAHVRVLGRCVVKNAPENAQPVLYVPFGSQLDNTDDQDVAAARAETKRQFGHPAAKGIGPAVLHALHASVIQLERPPRV